MPSVKLPEDEGAVKQARQAGTFAYPDALAIHSKRSCRSVWSVSASNASTPDTIAPNPVWSMLGGIIMIPACDLATCTCYR
jgi:hypothetical protein